MNITYKKTTLKGFYEVIANGEKIGVVGKLFNGLWAAHSEEMGVGSENCNTRSAAAEQLLQRVTEEIEELAARKVIVDQEKELEQERKFQLICPNCKGQGSGGNMDEDPELYEDPRCTVCSGQGFILLDRVNHVKILDLQFFAEPEIIHSLERAMYEFKEAGDVIVDITILDKMEDWLRELDIDFYTRINYPTVGAYEIGMK